MSGGDRITFINTTDNMPMMRRRRRRHLDGVTSGCDGRRCTGPMGESPILTGGGGRRLFAPPAGVGNLLLSFLPSTPNGGAVPGGGAVSVTLMVRRAQTMESICSQFWHRHPVDGCG